METKQVQELVLQSLEHELGGVKIYEAAVQCAQNADLAKEWSKYLDETKRHVGILQELCQAIGLDYSQETPGRKIVRHNGQALLGAIQMAATAGDPAAAELVACEVVVLAETKDHHDWQLIGKCAEHLSGPEAAAFKTAYDEVEDQEDEHLYHSKGWCRELWLKSLGINAVLPPPEERRQVKTAIGAAKAEQAAEKAR